MSNPEPQDELPPDEEVVDAVNQFLKNKREEPVRLQKIYDTPAPAGSETPLDPSPLEEEESLRRGQQLGRDLRKLYTAASALPPTLPSEYSKLGYSWSPHTRALMLSEIPDTDITSLYLTAREKPNEVGYYRQESGVDSPLILSVHGVLMDDKHRVAIAGMIAKGWAMRSDFPTDIYVNPQTGQATKRIIMPEMVATKLNDPRIKVKHNSQPLPGERSKTYYLTDKLTERDFSLLQKATSSALNKLPSVNRPR